MEKILLVDDSRQEREAIKAALSCLYPRFIEAADGLSAVKAFVEEKPGLVITDIEMPNLNGYRFVSTIRSMEDGREVPIILLSGTKNSLKNKITGFDLGASDFLLKPFEGEELLARVKSLLKMKSLVEELREKNAMLEKLAVTDELTGLNNRRYFFESVREQMALVARHNIRIACLLMDIDNFKKINDSYGHMAGDGILKKIGSLLKACKREGEILARFGGEEFIICIFNTDPAKALLAAERFRKLVAECDFSPVSPGLRISMSVGAAVYPHDKVTTIDELINAADKALYQSKSAGRDRVTVFEWQPEPSA